MTTKLTFVASIMLMIVGTASAVVIDMAGGTAHLSDGTDVVTTDTGLWTNVEYYIEDGVRIDFVGGYGIIGDYYSTGPGGPYYNSVIHAHPFYDIDIVFSKVDGSSFDLNYVDMTSNTDTGGDLASGNEASYITADAASMLLPSSDWGFDYTWYGNVGDGVQRLWLSSDFDNIKSFTCWSENAYCFGMDNFYIDEPAPSNILIDIKPGSYPNSINLGKKGVTPVAILTTDDFDALAVDPMTIEFAEAIPLRWAEEDVDGDGDMDLILHFATQELDLTESSTEAALSGETWDGIVIAGSDSVRIVPPK